jgi:hypothetical protein
VTPDTVITLTTGQILRVRESAEDVIQRIVEFRRRTWGADAEPSGLCHPSEDSEVETVDEAADSGERN